MAHHNNEHDEPAPGNPAQDNATDSPHDETAPTTDEHVDPDSDPTEHVDPDNPNPSANFDPTNPAFSLVEKYAHLYGDSYPDALAAAAQKSPVFGSCFGIFEDIEKLPLLDFLF